MKTNFGYRRIDAAALLACLCISGAVPADDFDSAVASSCPGYPAWAHLHPSTEIRGASANRAGSDAALAAQLITMAAEDQQARPLSLFGNLRHPDPIASNPLLVVDRRLTDTRAGGPQGHQCVLAAGPACGQRQRTAGAGSGCV
jgi:hypothetical protein